MRSRRSPRSILVPILAGDITDAVLARAASALADSGARLALVHVAGPRALAHGPPAEQPAPVGVGVARWRRLAALARPDRLWVDAACGDAAEVILSQGKRFASDLIVLGEADPALAEVLRSAPGRVLIAAERGDAYMRTTAPARSAAAYASEATRQLGAGGPPPFRRVLPPASSPRGLAPADLRRLVHAG